jgi:hypothetical protein
MSSSSRVVRVVVEGETYTGHCSVSNGRLLVAFGSVRSERPNERPIGSASSLLLARQLLYELVQQRQKRQSAARRAARGLKQGAPSSSGRSLQTKIAYFRDRAARWTWRLISCDGHVINESEKTFDARKDCEADAQRAGVTPHTLR